MIEFCLRITRHIRVLFLSQKFNVRMSLFEALRGVYDSILYWIGLGGRGNGVPLSRADQLLSEQVKTRWEIEQNNLKQKLDLTDSDVLINMVNLDTRDEKTVQYYIGGVDISFVKGDDINACAALVVLSYPELKPVYQRCKMVQLTEPYIPGFLAFREVPFILELFDELKRVQPELMPHVVMVDGNGILHPKGFGSASHLGVCVGLPCIGVAKKLFHVDGLEKDAEHGRKIATLQKGGDTFPLVGQSGKTYGMCLRSCDTAPNPVYVSPGHLVTMDTAVRLVHRCCKYRVPEPVRLADITSREYLRDNFKPDTANEPT